MEAECAEALAWEYRERRDQLSERLLAIIERALSLAPAELQRARRTADACRALLPELFERHDVLLTPSAPGEAPEGLDTTGNPIFCRTWTLLACPVANVPGLRGPSGLPVGVQLVGPPGADATVLGAAAWLAPLLAR
jgi:Asp-tRNA(Asn)/Glu-tRNA(Gln) amidotransferase A subunit family amidase